MFYWLFFNPLFAAGPVTHAYLAKKGVLCHERLSFKQEGSFLKLLEDEFFYQKENWDKVKKYLITLDFAERKYKILKQDLIRWHKILMHSFSIPPSEYLSRLAKNNKGFFNIPPEIIKKWSILLPVFAKKNVIRQYVIQLDKHFDEIFLENS